MNQAHRQYERVCAGTSEQIIKFWYRKQYSKILSIE